MSAALSDPLAGIRGTRVFDARQRAICAFLTEKESPMDDLEFRHARARFALWVVGASDAEIAGVIRDLAPTESPRTASEALRQDAAVRLVAEHLGWLEEWRNRLAQLGLEQAGRSPDRTAPDLEAGL